MLSPTNSRLLPPPTRWFTEQRVAQRFCPDRMLTGYIALTAGESISALVQNLSITGVALLSRRPLPSGSEAKVQLVNTAATFSLLVAVRVVRCSPLMTGEYLLGCRFDRALKPGELMPFLA
jgi:hypothetical protein